ncbi:hypothetical protein JOB18_002318 [Solea senegalensis]|uniref:Uncharacterized protein n=1 Tax=Solea senegalensis TaxID=28829 RepID=A0AAV6QU36_SOLSE|nr:hypothetical protein JOB18_002318 [Solea senegalensis]
MEPEQARSQTWIVAQCECVCVTDAAVRPSPNPLCIRVAESNVKMMLTEGNRRQGTLIISSTSSCCLSACDR